MAIGDQYRQIEPGDRWIEDSAGNIVGVQNPRGKFGAETRWLTADQVSATQALVSVAGNLAYAAVATTTGTPGEMRKLSDGPDAGAVLVWSIPEGSTSYAWCWQIYPLAAYL